MEVISGTLELDAKVQAEGRGEKIWQEAKYRTVVMKEKLQW